MSRHALDAKHYISSETLDLERKKPFWPTLDLRRLLVDGQGKASVFHP